jgi:hypothetical protein
MVITSGRVVVDVVAAVIEVMAGAVEEEETTGSMQF